MSSIRNIQITIPASNDYPNHHGVPSLASHSECSINIQVNQDWIVTGEYCNNTLCAIRLQRSSCEERRK